MRKDLKGPAIAELHEKFSRARVAVLTETVGLTSNEATELRRQLRGAKAELKVVKNTLAMLAADGTPMAGVKEHFKGALSVAIGYDDPALPAKILRDFIAKEKRDKKMRITVGWWTAMFSTPPASKRSPSCPRVRFSWPCCFRPCKGRCAE